LCFQHGYFNALRAEVAADNVKVSIVCPGPVESEISLKTHRNPNNPVQVRAMKNQFTVDRN
jgi:short-subunit dehydrogenase